MGYQSRRQAQQPSKTSDRHPEQVTPVVTRQQATEEAVQELLGSRAASRQLRSEMQQGQSSQPLLQMVQKISPVSPRSQGKLSFRGMSQEWGGASSGLVVQPKLTIGEPNDRYEQEADRVAQQVVQQMQSPPVAQTGAGVEVQRRTDEDEEELQRKSESLLLGEAVGGMVASGELEASIRQARGGGAPLPETVREPMERVFGADFSGVRIHANDQADQLNRSISAKAFTTGQDVFVRQGAYQPESREGQELLAHELTHVVQQEKFGKTGERRNAPLGRSFRCGELVQRVSIVLGNDASLEADRKRRAANAAGEYELMKGKLSDYPADEVLHIFAHGNDKGTTVNKMSVEQLFVLLLERADGEAAGIPSRIQLHVCNSEGIAAKLEKMLGDAKKAPVQVRGVGYETFTLATGEDYELLREGPKAILQSMQNEINRKYRTNPAYWDNIAKAEYYNVVKELVDKKEIRKVDDLTRESHSAWLETTRENRAAALSNTEPNVEGKDEGRVDEGAESTAPPNEIADNNTKIKNELLDLKADVTWWPDTSIDVENIRERWDKVISEVNLSQGSLYDQAVATWKAIKESDWWSQLEQEHKFKFVEMD